MASRLHVEIATAALLAHQAAGETGRLRRVTVKAGQLPTPTSPAIRTLPNKAPMLIVRLCPVCDRRYKAKQAQVYCSRQCYDHAAQTLNRMVNLRPTLSQSLRRSILDRDQWACRICGDPINRDARWPAPDSPVIDHITPRVHGGSDHPTNLQAAHAYCNGAKGKRLGFEFATT